MSRASPARSSRITGKLAANSSYGRDLFRTSTPQTTRTSTFAPALPKDATKPTPSIRRFAQKNSHVGMSGMASTEPFKMRIPSPDPELSGEALSKQVPDDPNRSSTIYADQFLAHKCPPNFDDVQRRQFFCILDLRRLKYAADEIFAKKDWKLNIMNFAKEYEKSRGLIMLRYGLYEFKNVKPSEEVLKRWRATHNLPEPEPAVESTTAGTPMQSVRRTGVSGNASTKRKAEDDLPPKDNALMASTANQNKRRNFDQELSNAALSGPAPFKKSKRKADDEPDENQPNKVHKPSPSAARSKFENILNKAQSGNTSPLKGTAAPAFGTRKPKPSAYANGFKPATIESIEDESASSVLAEHKIGSMPAKSTSNIFSYLSESSANSSGNENGNADDGETESEEEEETASQEAPPSDQPSAASSAITQGSSTLFPASKPTTNPSLFGGLTRSNDSVSKGGLFDRVQMGSNGQPLRATSNVEDQNVPPSSKQPLTEKQQDETPAKRPGDYTFNAATTPISFGPPASNIAKPPATISTTESAKGPNESKNTSTPQPPAALFGAGATVKGFNPTPASLFGGANQTSNDQVKSNVVASSIFSSQKSGTSASSLFGSRPTKSLFGDVKQANEAGSPAREEQQNSVSNATPEPTGSAPKVATSEAPVSKGTASIFGTPAVSTAATTQAQSLFGNSVNTAESKPQESVSSPSLFGNAEKVPTPSLFGASPSTTSFATGSTKANGSGAAKSIFDAPNKQPSTSFLFSTPKPEATSEANTRNGSGQGIIPPSVHVPKPSFGIENSKPPAPPTPSLFGGNSTAPASSFSVKSNEAGPAEKTAATTTSLFNFGDRTPAEKKDESVTTKPSSIFNNTSSSTGPALISGAQTTTTNNTQPPSAPSVIFGAGAESKKPDFQFGGSATGTSTTPFTFGQGATSSGSDSGFTFTAGGGGQSFNNPFASSSAPSSAPTFGSKPPTPSPSSSFGFTFGQQPPSTPNPAPAAQGASLFGASSNAGNGAPSFSFTQATPPQNNLFAPKPPPSISGSFGSMLQAGGDAPTGASSPFPAPSSIGTTPVNGTPEPQTQNEDGEEGPQEQLSLTDGGPGEEDETILHEVRAKAIKYIPVVKGSDEEEEKKSPWSTQGVGPLRVLKNKANGTVRVLLRAEPRGHIALNKTILPDVEYKVKDKTVNFVASDDSGSGLETWVLQVKKPDFAQQLAGVLEAHKVANKK